MQPIASGQVTLSTPAVNSGAAPGSSPPGAVVAASPTPPAIAETERIIVVGSYVPSANEAAVNPVLTINQGIFYLRISA